LGAKRVELIRESWKQNRAVHQIMAFLQSFGIGTARAFSVDTLAGTFAGIAMAMNAVATAILAPIILGLFGV